VQGIRLMTPAYIIGSPSVELSIVPGKVAVPGTGPIGSLHAC